MDHQPPAVVDIEGIDARRKYTALRLADRGTGNREQAPLAVVEEEYRELEALRLAERAEKWADRGRAKVLKAKKEYDEWETARPIKNAPRPNGMEEERIEMEDYSARVTNWCDRVDEMLLIQNNSYRQEGDLFRVVPSWPNLTPPRGEEGRDHWMHEMRNVLNSLSNALRRLRSEIEWMRWFYRKDQEAQETYLQMHLHQHGGRQSRSRSRPSRPSSHARAGMYAIANAVI